MTNYFEGLPFQPADILLPRNCDLTLWSVVACDQYTSQPEYWQRVEERVGRAPSALRLILPESSLDGPQVEMDIMDINATMARYVREGRFKTLPGAMIYVERVLHGGKVRRGLVGKVDLECYDYEPGSETPVRATEGTVMSRIPPRVAVRKNAPIELPHVMLLVDDPHRMIIEPLSVRTGEMELLYDFDLMEGGGHVAGWLVDAEGNTISETKLYTTKYKLRNAIVLYNPADMALWGIDPMTGLQTQPPAEPSADPGQVIPPPEGGTVPPLPGETGTVPPIEVPGTVEPPAETLPILPVPTPAPGGEEAILPPGA